MHAHTHTHTEYYNPSGKAVEEMPEWIVNEQREFEDKLDANKDGFLENNEIKEWLAPNDDEFINEEVEHLMNHIDDNKVKGNNLMPTHPQHTFNSQ